MPRKARFKPVDSVYHIICRSVSEVMLFKCDEDKSYYLDLLKKYLEKNRCVLYAYILMDNHLHLHLDPKNYDLSTFMHGLNTAYVRYFNKKYQRHGPLFQERFESRVLDTDAYNFAVSAYIHNNSKDIEGYEGKEETYRYSSYGFYLGINKDTRNIVDKSFMKDLFDIKDDAKFKVRYQEFVSHQRDMGTLGEIYKMLTNGIENEYVSGTNVIIRDQNPSKVVSVIFERIMKFKKEDLGIKSNRKILKYRAFTAYILRVLCGLSYKEICKNIYNITISGCSRLCNKGFELLKEDIFLDIFNDLAYSKL